jgi:hypothetical protein
MATCPHAVILGLLSLLGCQPGPVALPARPPLVVATTIAVVSPSQTAVARAARANPYPDPPACLVTSNRLAATARMDATAVSSTVPDIAYGVVESERSATPPPRQVGRIQCGNTSCETGKEVCCQGSNLCVRVMPWQLDDISDLDRFCDSKDSLLVGCDESTSCGKGKVCCEIMLGSGQNSPIVCQTPRPGERLPCDYGEVCVPGVPCSTPGAQCVDGWCFVKPRKPLRCGSSVCSGRSRTCCKLPTGRSQCRTEEQCSQASGESYDCTSAAHCGEGEFCGVMAAGGGHCMQSNDGMTTILCNTAADCPKSVIRQCDQFDKPTVCGDGTCGCGDE